MMRADKSRLQILHVLMEVDINSEIIINST